MYHIVVFLDTVTNPTYTPNEKQVDYSSDPGHPAPAIRAKFTLLR